MAAATQDGPDTWLARLLLGSRRLDLPALQRCLAESRSTGRPLEELLVLRGHLAQAEVAALVASYRERESPAQGSEGRLQVGELVGDAYRVAGLLGQGGMGAVYRVVEVATGRELALKVLLEGLEGDVEVERFRREAEAAARLSQRSGFVQIHASGTHRGLLYYVMEVVEGDELEARIDELSPEELARVLATVARSLSSFHAGGFVHRDLKPANVLLGSDGQPRIVDLGLVSDRARAGLTATGEVLGTPSYMAPEQVVDAREVDARSDLYALGAILYRGLSGQVPFSGHLIAVLSAVVNSEPERPSSLRAGVPPALEAVCLRAMAKEPSRRYASADELAEELERFVAGELEAPPAVTPRALLLWTGFVGCLVALGAWLALTWADEPASRPASSSPPPRSTPTPTASAEDSAEVLAEVRQLLAEKRYQRAQRRSAALNELPPDVRWGLALYELRGHLDRVERREELALETGKPEVRSGDHRTAAVREAFAPCHAALEGLRGEHALAARRELAKRLVRDLKNLRQEKSRSLEPWEAQRGASLAQLIHVLAPQWSFTPEELDDLVPTWPFREGARQTPTLDFAEALSALAPDSEPLHSRIAVWTTFDPTPEVQRRLLPIVDRALELGPPDDKLLDIKILRLGCLLDGTREWDQLVEEAKVLLAGELNAKQRARVLELRGRVHFRRQALPQALEDFSASLPLFNSTHVRAMRARTHYALGQHALAAKEADELLEIRRPESVQVHVTMVAMLWDIDRQNPRLWVYVDRLARHKPNEAGWGLRLALLECERGSPTGRLREVLSKCVTRLGQYQDAGRPSLGAAIRAMQPEAARALGLLEKDLAQAQEILRGLVEKVDRLRGEGQWP